MTSSARNIMTVTLFFILLLVVSGCGGGSSPHSTGKIKTSVKTTGLVPAGQLVGIMDIIISMPYGVTVQCTPGTTNPLQGVVQLIGTSDPNMLLQGMNYTPATPTTPGKLEVVYANAAGFKPSDSLLIELDVTTGFFPKSADFALDRFEVATFSNGNQSAVIDVNDPSLFTVNIL